jgi:predicted nucleotidyltransferase component of viral defense system
MAEDRLKIWETLFQRALVLIDSTDAAGAPLTDWSFGGGTVLMRRHNHRFSKDVDIFVPDSQWIGYLTPRLNDVAETLTTDYVEAAQSLKLRFPEGEIDFVASQALTDNPTTVERLFGRDVAVETSAEIVAKKIWHRGEQFTARDIFDLSMVSELEPDSLLPIAPILHSRREVILKRIATQQARLREDFEALEGLNYRRNFDECAARVQEIFA